MHNQQPQEKSVSGFIALIIISLILIFLFGFIGPFIAAANASTYDDYMAALLCTRIVSLIFVIILIISIIKVYLVSQQNAHVRQYYLYQNQWRGPYSQGHPGTYSQTHKTAFNARQSQTYSNGTGRKEDINTIKLKLNRLKERLINGEISENTYNDLKAELEGRINDEKKRIDREAAVKKKELDSKKALEMAEAATRSEIVNILMMIEGMDQETARRIFNAGFKDEERLYDASISDLTRIEGIDDEFANRIQAYFRKDEGSVITAEVVEDGNYNATLDWSQSAEIQKGETMRFLMTIPMMSHRIANSIHPHFRYMDEGIVPPSREDLFNVLGLDEELADVIMSYIEERYGKNVDSNNEFLTIEKEPRIPRCPECGTEINIDVNFCPQCGNKVKQNE